MEILGGIGTAIMGLLVCALVMGLFYFILGSLTNTDIKHGSGKKIIITSKEKHRRPQDVYADKYAEEFINEMKKQLPIVRAELKEKGIEMSDKDILIKIYEEKTKKKYI